MPPWLPGVIVAIALYVIGQAAVLLIWGANLSARVKVLEREASRGKQVSDDVISLTGKVDNIGDDVKEIKGLIDGLRGPLRRPA